MWIPSPSTLDRDRECLIPLTKVFPFGRELSVGTELRLESDARSPYEVEDREADDREENETVDDGGECGGNGMLAGSTRAKDG